MNLSKVFSRASVSEIRSAKWQAVEGSQAKLSKADCKLVTQAIVLECEGKFGSYKAVKLTVESLGKAFWFNLDAASSNNYEHLEEIDASSMIVYDLTDGEKTITRVRIM